MYHSKPARAPHQPRAAHRRPAGDPQIERLALAFQVAILFGLFAIALTFLTAR